MSTTAAKPYKTTAEVARELNLELWQLQRFLTLSRVPEPGRVGSMRAWTERDIERAREALGQGSKGDQA
jgi:hypothetical protein